MTKIYIAYTGGTIGMKQTAHGWAPAPGYLAEQMAAMSELRHPSMPEYVIDEFDELLDSSNMIPSDWSRIARNIAAHYDAYDGFVVIHGTDTMAYTASALAFLLEGLDKPVVLTGSQIPLCEVRNDGRSNLVTSLLVAATQKIPEVTLCFGDRLVRGCRSVKVSADGFDAFDSPNFPPLGSVGVDIEIDWPLVRPAPAGGLKLDEIGHPIVGALRLFPGITAELARNVLQPPLQGLVLEAYGVGNAPERNAGFIAAIREAVTRGVVIVDCTQCLHGSVDLGDYSTGSVLARAGVISGYDMTVEAALTKLVYLFGRGLSPDDVKLQMQLDLRGELTR
ncbi:MAG: asparaginase [Acidobacteria bacterium]|nr:asparaginase [Acidobacteriota bacterium]